MHPKISENFEMSDAFLNSLPPFGSAAGPYMTLSDESKSRRVTALPGGLELDLDVYLYKIVFSYELKSSSCKN